MHGTSCCDSDRLDRLTVGGLYSGIFHSDSVVMVSSLFDIYISGWLDGARKGDCSLLPVWCGRIRELELPSGWSLRTRWL
jgi:hypothetical protein